MKNKKRDKKAELEGLKQQIEKQQCSMCQHFKEGMCHVDREEPRFRIEQDTCGQWVCYIDIAKHFTETPGGRFRSMHARDGESGEELREFLLRPALETNRPVIVDVTGTFGMCASFGSEAFEVLLDSYPETEREARFQQFTFHAREYFRENIIGMMEDSVNRAKKTVDKLAKCQQNYSDALYDER